MRERRDGHGLHVVGENEVPPGQRCAAARELEQREGAARAGADLDARRRARRGDEIDHVEADRLRDVDVLDCPLHRDQRLCIDDPLERELVLTPLEPPVEHGDLVVAAGVPDRGAEDEPVELRLGERVGAFVLDRVLGREHEERRPEGPCLPVHRDLPFLHRLEEGRLCLRRGAVDLVCEEEAGEDRARAELELARPLVVDRRAR